MIPGPNWTRRYGSAARRLCARAGCGAPAAATLRFQPTQREAWLVDLEDDVARTEGDLCARHATALVLPRGWALHDQRQHPRAATVPDPDPDPVPPRVRRAPRVRPPRREPAPMLPGLALAAEERAVPAPAPRPEDVAAAKPTPADELATLLDARTPLLRRAFGNVDIDLDV